MSLSNTAASDGLHGLRTSLLTGPVSMTTTASASAPISYGESVYSAFPEGMLRALETSTLQQRAAPRTSSTAVPILLMVPVAMDVAADVAAPMAIFSSRVQHPASALSHLLEVSGAGSSTAASPAGSAMMGKALSVLAPAFNPASLMMVAPGVASAAAEPPRDSWAFPVPRLPPPSVSDFPVSLPSFGERTAAAKRMASAAPGGPVTQTNDSQIWKAVNYQEVPFFDPFAERKRKNKKGFCPFCKKNGESSRTYSSHSLTQCRDDGSLVVTCPILRRLRCDICGATGDGAHTRSHCPKGSKQLAVATILKNTPRRCDGSFRFIK